MFIAIVLSHFAKVEMVVVAVTTPEIEAVRNEIIANREAPVGTYRENRGMFWISNIEALIEMMDEWEQMLHNCEGGSHL